MRYLTLIPLLFLFLAAPLRAVEYHGLYHAEVEVPDQGNDARAAGMQQAMSEVLLKVSGTERATEDESIANAMESASRYVQQYRYRTEPIPEDEQKPDDAGNVVKQRLMLSVRFDQKSIDELLRQSGFTVWGDARPTTLIWLGVEQNGKRLLVGANDGGLVKDLIDAEAKRRALPVKMPLLDLTDQSRVRAADIWGDFLDTIKQASQRYTPQAILVGRLYPLDSGNWEARWTLVHRGNITRWQQQSAQIQDLIAGGVGHTSELLVQSFTQSFDAGSGTMLMQVDGIGSLKQYRRVLDYLNGVHGVSAVIADKVTPNSINFHVQTDGGIDAVLQTIALGDVLEKVDEPVTESSPVVSLPKQPEGTEQTRENMGGQSGGTPAVASGPGTTSNGTEQVASKPSISVLHYRLAP